jgi:hypothetical protein
MFWNSHQGIEWVELYYRLMVLCLMLRVPYQDWKYKYYSLIFLRGLQQKQNIKKTHNEKVLRQYTRQSSRKKQRSNWLKLLSSYSLSSFLIHSIINGISYCKISSLISLVILCDASETGSRSQWKYIHHELPFAC